MISFAPTEEQEMARQAMREFAVDVLRPAARDCDEASEVPDGVLDEVWQLGLTSTAIPAEHGGGGEAGSPILNALVLEELAFGDASLALAAASPALFVTPLVEQGTDGQKSKYLPAFCGEKFQASSMALVEPGAFFDPMQLSTRAKRRGDVWVLNGRKSFVPLAGRARHLLVVAASGEDALDAFIVPREADGLTISEPERNLGLRALATHGLTLDDVEVPASDRLGGERGCDVRRIVNAGRAALASVLTGLSRAVVEYCVPYAKDRVAFGEAIARKQAIAFMLADMTIETDAMRWMAWKAASRLESGADASRSAGLARSYAAEQAMKIADDGVQVLGGHGYIRDYPVEMWFRNARTLGVLEGAVTL